MKILYWCPICKREGVGLCDHRLTVFEIDYRKIADKMLAEHIKPLDNVKHS